jgi:hypothetical protein
MRATAGPGSVGTVGRIQHPCRHPYRRPLQRTVSPGDACRRRSRRRPSCRTRPAQSSLRGASPGALRVSTVVERHVVGLAGADVGVVDVVGAVDVVGVDGVRRVGLGFAEATDPVRACHMRTDDGPRRCIESIA